MSKSEKLPSPVVANLSTLSELNQSLGEKYTAEPGDGLYPRDGVVLVSRVEEQVSEVTLPGKNKNIIWASGMAAVRETVNLAATLKARSSKKAGPIIAHSTQLYSQSKKFFENEKRKGVKVIGFDSDDEEENLLSAFEEKDVDVIFAETVANAPGMPVLNLENLLEYVRTVESPPIAVLDNTLALKTGIDFEQLLKPDDPVIIVESGTKNLMNNSELLGLSYSANEDLIERLRHHKAHSGAINSVSSLDKISAKVESAVPGFHDRNRRLFKSTGKIALALAEAQTELGEDTDFCTTFPTIDTTHPHHEYAKKITPEGVDFISPVVFITARDWREEKVQALVRRITEHPAILAQINQDEIHLGQSFGLPKARILYDNEAPNLRFAGGYNLADEEALAQAIKEAAADI